MSSGLKSRIFPLVLMAIRTGLSGEASDRGCNSAISALVSGARGPRGLSREESAGLSGGSLAEASSGRALSKSVIFVPKDFVPNDNSFCFSCIIQELLALFRANQPNNLAPQKNERRSNSAGREQERTNTFELPFQPASLICWGDIPKTRRICSAKWLW